MSVRLLSGVSAKLAEETELEQAASMLQKLQRGRIARKLWDKTLMESRLKQVRARDPCRIFVPAGCNILGRVGVCAESGECKEEGPGVKSPKNRVCWSHY